MKRLLQKPSLQLRFTLLCMLEFIVVLVAAEALAWLLDRWLGITLHIPTALWALALSVILGGVIAKYISRTFFAPITKLEQAMRAVAAGDFQAAAETNSQLPEVKSLYDSFNRMVAELDATQTLQTDFISNVSHEFKTPITAIEGYAAMLDSAATPEERAAYIEKLRFNARRLSVLTGNILLLSKLTNQSIAPPCTTFRLDEQIRQAIVALEEKWTARDIELDVALDAVEYTGPEALLQHVWTNLLDNAIKFDPVGGRVALRLHQTGKNAVCTVDDDGPGVPEELRRRIFQKFYQGDTSHRAEGNGLGLALVSQIVTRCGGQVGVEPRPQGGSRFTVTLPMN